MITLLCLDNIFEVLPFLLAPLVFVAVFVAFIVIAVRKAAAAKRQQSMEQYKSTYTDGNGRTQHQRDYLAKKRAEQSERKVNQADAHSHKSTSVERYDSIVGSLGEVYDEVCYELDGVRLVEHDESYCDAPEHFVDADYSELQKAIVLGEVLNAPRFKQPHGRR